MIVIWSLLKTRKTLKCWNVCTLCFNALHGIQSEMEVNCHLKLDAVQQALKNGIKW